MDRVGAYRESLKAAHSAINAAASLLDGNETNEDDENARAALQAILQMIDAIQDFS